MYTWEATPTINDFDSVDWQSAIAGSSEDTCDSYGDMFHKRAVEADSSSQGEHVFGLLSYVCFLVLQIDTPDTPFVDFAGNNIRLEEAQKTTLLALLPNIHDVELRARIADILWVFRFGEFYPTAQTAVRAYIESATRLEDPENWTESERRIHRALQIALSLGRNNNVLFREVIEHIETMLDKYQGKDPLFLSARLMQHLLEVNEGDPTKYAALAENAAITTESNTNGVVWDRARTYWEIASKWFQRNGDEENSQRALANTAETYVREAETLPDNYPQRFAVAAWHVQSAIEAYKRIPGTESRREELHRILLTYQRESISGFGVISSEIDISELIEQAIAVVKGKSFHKSLFALAFATSSPRKALLRKHIEERIKVEGLWFWIPTKELDSQGKTKAKRPGLSEDEEATIRAEMLREAAHQQGLIAEGVVRPAVYQINLEHHFDEQDFLSIVTNNPFIPQGREAIYARGLCAGLKGDMLVSTHLLVPQVENSLRHLLQSHGHITSGLDNEGIQDEYTLQKVLYTYKTQLESILGEDLFFDLQGLLVERFGTNLRNLVAHGLMVDRQFTLKQTLYLWWLTLRMCCLPIYTHIEDGDDTDSSQETL